MPTQAELKRAAAVMADARTLKLTDPEGKVCPRCNGTGRIVDDALRGREMRAKRDHRGLSGREVARRMGYSAAYVCDLELGRRSWNTEVTRRYLSALEGA